MTTDPSESRPNKILALLLAAGAWGMLVAQIIRFAALVYESPASKWNDLRLAPTLYLCHGINIFGTAEMPGVTALYGPAALVAYAPAALAHSPEGAIRIGYLCVMVYVLAAVLLPSILMGRAIGAATGRRFSWMLLIAPLAVISVTPFLGSGLLLLHSDLPAICCLSLAGCALATRARGFLFWGAALSVLALGCKITYGAGAVALFLATWRLEGLRPALRFAVQFTLLFLLALAVAAHVWGLWPMIDAVVIVPAKQAWVLNLDLAGANVAQFKSAGWHWLSDSALWKPLCALQTLLLLAVSLLPPGLLIVAFLCASPPGKGEPLPASASLRRWSVVWASLAVMLLPASVMGYTKIGGAFTALSGMFLFVLLLVAVSALPWLDERRRDPRLAAFGVAAACILSLRLLSLAGFDAMHAKNGLYPKLAVALGASPDQLWLPSRPLAHWFYQGRITHSGDVLWCYHLAGRDWPSGWLQRYLPPKVAFITGYRADEPEKGFGLHEDMAPAPALPGLDDDFPVFAWPLNTKKPSH